MDWTQFTNIYCHFLSLSSFKEICLISIILPHFKMCCTRPQAVLHQPNLAGCICKTTFTNICSPCILGHVCCSMDISIISSWTYVTSPSPVHNFPVCISGQRAAHEWRPSCFWIFCVFILALAIQQISLIPVN